MNDIKRNQRKNKEKRHVGIVGGSFDPITIGHIELAKFVLSSEIGIDEIWLMPCDSHVQKDIKTPNGHRLNMCQISIRDENNPINVSDYEFQHEILGGTCNLLNHISNNKCLFDYEFYFVIGMDNANNFHKWINYKELLEKAKFIVVPRKGFSRNANVDWYFKPPHIFLDKPNNIPNISSTEVRDEIRMLNELENSNDTYDQEAYDMLETCLLKSVGFNVLEYIKEQKIYHE